MPFSTSLGTLASGPAISNGSGEPMLKAHATWWLRRSPSEAESSFIRRRRLSTGFQPNPSTRPRQSLESIASITSARRPLLRKKSKKGLRRDWMRYFLNPANVIGRYDWGTWSQFIRLAANRQLLRIPPGRACYCDVGSVVRAHLAAAQKGQTGHNYILGGSEASYAEIVQMVGKLLRQRTNTGVGRPLVLRSAGRVSEWISGITGKEPRITPELAAIVCGSIICRSDKATRELEYLPASLETMFRDCIDWMVAEDLLRRPAVRR